MAMWNQSSLSNTNSFSIVVNINKITLRGSDSSPVRVGFNMTKSFIGAASFELPW